MLDGSEITSFILLNNPKKQIPSATRHRNGEQQDPIIFIDSPLNLNEVTTSNGEQWNRGEVLPKKLGPPFQKIFVIIPTQL